MTRGEERAAARHSGSARLTFANFAKPHWARGAQFESVVAYLLEREPTIATVRSYRPALLGGIDLVAVTRSGRRIAVMTKAIAASYGVRRSDVLWLRDARRFDRLVLVTTTPRLQLGAREEIERASDRGARVDVLGPGWLRSRRSWPAPRHPFTSPGSRIGTHGALARWPWLRRRIGGRLDLTNTGGARR